jgi:hypothetical protein
VNIFGVKIAIDIIGNREWRYVCHPFDFAQDRSERPQGAKNPRNLARKCNALGILHSASLRSE